MFTLNKNILFIICCTAIVFVITLHRVVITRQKYKRHLKGRPLAKPLRMFPGITFKDVDHDIPHCIKYLLNFGFYRFGVEVRTNSKINYKIVISFFS